MTSFGCLFEIAQVLVNNTAYSNMELLNIMVTKDRILLLAALTLSEFSRGSFFFSFFPPRINQKLPTLPSFKH